MLQLKYLINEDLKTINNIFDEFDMIEESWQMIWSLQMSCNGRESGRYFENDSAEIFSIWKAIFSFVSQSHRMRDVRKWPRASFQFPNELIWWWFHSSIE